VTQGFSGSYAINGTNLVLQPTSGRWNGRDLLGIDGAGHPIYPSIREFEMSWALISTTDFAQLNNFQLSVGNTGTVSVDLPKWGNAGYMFYSYSGCTLREPQAGSYFSADGYVQDVTMTIMGVRT